MGTPREELQDCLNGGVMHNWITRERTVSLMKDKSNGNITSNCRPINCLALVERLLVGKHYEHIGEHIDSQNLLPEEQQSWKI